MQDRGEGGRLIKKEVCGGQLLQKTGEEHFIPPSAARLPSSEITPETRHPLPVHSLFLHTPSPCGPPPLSLHTWFPNGLNIPTDRKNVKLKRVCEQMTGSEVQGEAGPGHGGANREDPRYGRSHL